MEALPKEVVGILSVFEDAFSARSWDWTQILVAETRSGAAGPDEADRRELTDLPGDT